MTAIVKEKTYKPLGFFVFDPLGDLEFFEDYGPAKTHAEKLVEKYRAGDEEFHDEAAEAVMLGIVLSFPGMLGEIENPKGMGPNGKITPIH